MWKRTGTREGVKEQRTKEQNDKGGNNDTYEGTVSHNGPTDLAARVRYTPSLSLPPLVCACIRIPNGQRALLERKADFPRPLPPTRSRSPRGCCDDPGTAAPPSIHRLFHPNSTCSALFPLSSEGWFACPRRFEIRRRLWARRAWVLRLGSARAVVHASLTLLRRRLLIVVCRCHVCSCVPAVCGTFVRAGPVLPAGCPPRGAGPVRPRRLSNPTRRRPFDNNDKAENKAQG
jgi:hypothetical protein